MRTRKGSLSGSGKGSSKGSEAGGSLENPVKSREDQCFPTKSEKEARRSRIGRGRGCAGKCLTTSCQRGGYRNTHTHTHTCLL